MFISTQVSALHVSARKGPFSGASFVATVCAWYELISPAGTTLYQLDVSARTIVCTYSIYKEAPEDGPLRSETCRADT